MILKYLVVFKQRFTGICISSFYGLCYVTMLWFGLTSITSFSIRRNHWTHNVLLECSSFSDLPPPFRIISLMILKRNFDYFCSSCGTYLASQGDGPDQYLTIWKWKEEKMVARKSAPAPEHYQLAFSNDQHTKITSCGKFASVLLNFLTRFTRRSLNFTWFFNLCFLMAATYDGLESIS